MTLEYQIKPSEDRVDVTGRGKSDFSDFLSLMNVLAADPEFSSDFNVIADFREVGYLPSFKEIKQFAVAFGQVRSSFKGKVGIVIKNKLQLRLGRFANLLAQLMRFEVAVFQESSLAIEWMRRQKVNEMSDLKAKIFEVLGSVQLTSLATITQDGRPRVRYVTTSATPDLTIRFATVEDSRKTAEIRANPEVHLVTGVSAMASAERWVQVEGRAEISTTRAERHDFWHDGLRAYFEGPDDPSYAVCVIKPSRIEYMTMSAVKPEVWEAGL